MLSTDQTETDGAGAAIRAIKAVGLAVTMPRLAVWMVLSRSDAPLLTAEIHRRLLSMGASASLSSVYQALKRLTSAGLVTVQDFDNGKAYYTLTSRRFRHRIICEDSGEEHWMAGTGLQGVIADFCQTQGFELHDYTLSIQASRVTHAPAKRSAGRRTPRPVQGKGQVPLRQGDVNHEDAIPTVLSDTG